MKFLGTAAARPTVGRNVSAIAVQREGVVMLFDCGEGTQRQMMRYGTGFALDDIFFTHLHADHFLGVTGLLRTLALQEREAEMRLWAPVGAREVLGQAVNLGVERLRFPVTIGELEPGQPVSRDDYDIVPYASRHAREALGYAIVEHERLGRFNPERARELGVPEGPLFGRLHRGEPVDVGGRIIRPADVVGSARPGRRVVYSGDTRPSHGTVRAAHGADLLIHEATFGRDEADRARLTGHSTAREAADVARKAGVRRLVLTHISARYADNPRPLEREARRAFPRTSIAYDGLEIDVPFPDEAENE